MLLQGLKVLDVASFIAAPVATTILADFGAEVIKVEPTGEGDTWRHTYTHPGYPRTEHNYPWLMDNRTKQGLALDLKSEEGRRILYQLAAEADVFVTNTPLESRRRLKIAYEDIAPLNERLIYASLTAYGEAGEEAGKTGFDSTALWARTGLMDMVKPAPDSAPARSLPGMGDHPTGVSLYAAIMTALYRRERTGRGGHVSTSLMANGLWWNAVAAQAMLFGSVFPHRPPREQTLNALANMYRCRDDRWFMLVLVNELRLWPRFVAAIERPDLAADPRFAELATRHRHARELTLLLDEVFAARDWAEWKQRLEAEGLTFGVVGKLQDIPHDPQMRASGALVPFGDPELSDRLTISSPLWVSGEEKVPPRRAPGHGEHTEAILKRLGYDDTAIAVLRQKGAIG